MSNEIVQKSIIWWKDWRLLLGIAMIILNFIAGFYGKSLIGIFIVKSLAKIHEPIYLITGISFWVFSWLLLFIGVFLVGWETIKMIQQRIKHHVKHTIKQTYHHARKLPKKSYRHIKKLHKKGIEKIRQIQNKYD